MSTETLSVRPVTSMVVGVAVLATAGIAVAVSKEMGWLDPVMAKRLVAIAIGAAMMVAGNALPKLLPLGTRRKRPFGVMAAERSAGWTFVLAGIPYLAVLIVAPIEYAMPAASLIGLAAFAVAGANWAWVLLRAPIQRRTNDGAPAPSPESRIRERGKQMAFVNFFFGFFWTFATFLADSVWGDLASRGMVWVFMILLVIGNGLLLPFVISRTEASR